MKILIRVLFKKRFQEEEGIIRGIVFGYETYDKIKEYESSRLYLDEILKIN